MCTSWPDDFGEENKHRVGVKLSAKGSIAAQKPESCLVGQSRKSESEHGDRESKEVGRLHQALEAMSKRCNYPTCMEVPLKEAL